jgi:hypothetical protein
MRQNGGLKSTKKRVKKILTVRDVTAMTEYAPQAITDLFNTVKAGIPAALMGGIIGDKAHTYGYHRGRNYVGGNDYSVQKPPDKKGNGEAASALDISWSTAQPQYDVSKRLLNAKNDSRMNCVREFYGSTDGRTVCGWDYYGNYAVTSDDSHLWHIHLSILREYADNHNALQGVADVITGKSSGSSGTGGDDVPQRLNVTRTEDVGLNANEVIELRFNNEATDTGNIFYGSGEPTGDEKGSLIKTDNSPYVSTFTCVVSGVASGQSVWTGLSWVDIASGETTGSGAWMEHVANGGDVNVVDTRVGHSGKGKGLKVRIKASEGATIKSGANWFVLYW